MTEFASLTFNLSLAVLVTLPCTAREGSAVVDPPQSKSPTVAQALSLGGTVLPVVVGAGLVTTGANKDSELALLVAGVYLGPALGHLYARQPGPALRGVALRTAILGVSLLALTQTGVCLESCEPGEATDEVVVVLVGSALTAASALYDIVTARRSAHRYNESRTTVSVVPWWSQSQRSGGVGVIVSF